jgi:Fe-S-cluster containining protein
MSTAFKESSDVPPRLIQIRGRSANDSGQGAGERPARVEALREEVARGLLYTHSRANANSNKLLEVAAFSYALIELLAERGLITVEELDERKSHVGRRLAEQFAEKGMGVALTREERVAGDDAAADVEIDCENRLRLCHAACCRLRFALTARDVEGGRIKWNLGQPYMIRQGDDGYCHHIDRASRRCGVYEDRPFVCRAYDCRKDKRIWEDFEQMKVSPELENLMARLDGASQE